jgi:hypothetical protein
MMFGRFPVRDTTLEQDIQKVELYHFNTSRTVRAAFIECFGRTGISQSFGHFMA